MVKELSTTIGATESARPRWCSRTNILLLLEGKLNEIGAAADCFAAGTAVLWLIPSEGPVCRRCHATASGAEEEAK